MRVSQIICREHGVPLVLDVRSATQSVMREVAESYEFVEGVLQRKPQADPDHFLRDLVFHDLGAMTRPLPVTRETKPGPGPGAVLGAQSE